MSEFIIKKILRNQRAAMGAWVDYIKYKKQRREAVAEVLEYHWKRRAQQCLRFWLRGCEALH